MPEMVNILPPDTLSLLEGYRLVREKNLEGKAGGWRRSVQKGGSIEFADYREYTPGDEPRRVDWKAYARLRRLYVREYLDDRKDCVLFLLDNSTSMDFGEPCSKLQYAAQIVAGMLACALAGQDLPAIAVAAGRGGRLLLTPGGRDSMFEGWRSLQGIECGSSSDLPGSLEEALGSVPQIGSLYLFSDLYDLEGLAALLRLAGEEGLEITLMHTLSAEEWRPGGEGDWALVDCETGERVEVSLSPPALADYARRLAEFTGRLDDLCRRWGARRVALDCGEGAGSTLLRTLPLAGVIRPR